MERRIEIIEGYDDSSCFNFRPVLLNESGKILLEEVVCIEEIFSIEEGNIECFLWYFLRKYFDGNLTYNKRRYDEDLDVYIGSFEWYLTHNFYTYDTLRKMVEEIENMATLLETDYNNPILDGVKENFSIFYMCDRNDEDYINGDYGAIPKHISVVTDFYRRFAKRITAMMENNKEAHVISVMGP